jgi:hypothetical protein
MATADAKPSSWWISGGVLLHQHAAALLWDSAQQHNAQQQPSKLGGQGVAMQAAARKLMAQQVVPIPADGMQPGSVLSSVSAAPFLVLGEWWDDSTVQYSTVQYSTVGGDPKPWH